MKEDLGFPIKYAVLELKRNGGYSTNYEDITVGFIVSKGYVVESKIKYFPLREPQNTYNIVFPFNNIAAFILAYESYSDNYREKKNVPYLNALGDYVPVNIVSEVFDTYGEAKEVAEMKNYELRENIELEVDINDPNYSMKFERKIMKFDHKLKTCQAYEGWITKNTLDLEVTTSNNLDATIKLRRTKRLTNE